MLITYKEVFPLIKNNELWAGVSGFSKDILFIPPNGFDITDKPVTALRTVEGITYLRSPSIWVTNIDHGRRHQPLPLMTMADNLKFSKHKEIKGKDSYDRYENYNAIEVPFTDAIPSDYDGVMGVPISFLDKYCPEQFEIIECREPCINLEVLKQNTVFNEYKSRQIVHNGILCQKTYHRVFIKRKR